MSQKTIKVPIITSISSTYLMTVHLVFHEDERNAYQCPFSSAYSLYHVKIHKPDRVQQFISITHCFAMLVTEHHEHHWPQSHVGHRTARTPQLPPGTTNTTYRTGSK